MEIQKGSSATRAKNKYNAQKYDSIRIMIPKGQKSEIASVARAAGESLNGFISKAIEDYTIRYKHSLTKVYTIVAGVNGTGKSSFIGALTGEIEFNISIDDHKITAFNKVFLFDNNKIAIDCINECLDDNISFSQETTLADSKIEVFTEKAKEKGFYVKLIYIGLDTPEECIKRIANRAARGGRDIGEVDIRRRFAERWRVLKRILPYCNEASFYDNDNGFCKVADYHDGELTLNEEAHKTWVLEFSDYLKRNKIKQ